MEHKCVMEERVRNLEIADAKIFAKIDGLVERTKDLMRQMDNLVKALWGFAASILMALVGFFIWYVQGR